MTKMMNKVNNMAPVCANGYFGGYFSVQFFAYYRFNELMNSNR